MKNFEHFKSEVINYGESNGYTPSSFELITCTKGHELFEMYSDYTKGGCGIICTECDEGISVADSADYMEEIVQNTCVCESEKFYIMLAKAYYEDSADVRWVYIGGMCPNCRLAGVYVDWAER